MKKNFKKSKFVILPALATLVLTGVASVTGTMAWFTANRAATVNASTFESKAEGSDLMVTTTANENAGTKKEEASATDSISVVGSLTHSSYAAVPNKTGILYAPVLGDSEVTAYRSLGTVGEHVATDQAGYSKDQNLWLVDNSESTDANKLWYAVAWTMQFTQAANASTDTNHLFFNPALSVATDGNKDKGENRSIDGFRIALMTNTNCIVVGKDNKKTHVTSTERFAYATSAPESFDTNATYVDSTSHQEVKVTEENFDAKKADIRVRTLTDADFKDPVKYTQFATATDQVTDYATDLTTNPNYLGQIDSKTGLTITAVAWFEGTNDKVVSSSIMSKVSASLGFYSRKARAK